MQEMQAVNRRLRPHGWLASLLLLCGLAAAQQPALLGPANYSAVMVIHLRGGATQHMAVAKRGRMWRSTIAMPGRGSMVQLINLKTGMAYMIMPPMCMQRALPSLPPAGVLAQAQRDHARITDLGPAVVRVGDRSYAVEHRRVDDQHAGKGYVVDAYTANALQNFPVKTVMQQNGRSTTVSYRHIRLAVPAASLFVPPAHCSAMPGLPGMPHF